MGHFSVEISRPPGSVLSGNQQSDVRSSFYCEEVATEFDVQGLELDWACACWDADFRHVGGRWAHYSFRGTKWQQINTRDGQLYLKNAYRVILTRARQGMILFVPSGSPEDPTRPPTYYDQTFEFLRSCGLRMLDVRDEGKISPVRDQTLARTAGRA